MNRGMYLEKSVDVPLHIQSWCHSCMTCLPRQPWDGRARRRTARRRRRNGRGLDAQIDHRRSPYPDPYVMKDDDGNVVVSLIELLQRSRVRVSGCEGQQRSVNAMQAKPSCHEAEAEAGSPCHPTRCATISLATVTKHPTSASRHTCLL